MLLLQFAFERFHDFPVVASDKRATRMNGPNRFPIPGSNNKEGERGRVEAECVARPEHVELVWAREQIEAGNENVIFPTWLFFYQYELF